MTSFGDGFEKGDLYDKVGVVVGGGGDEFFFFFFFFFF